MKMKIKYILLLLFLFLSANSSAQENEFRELENDAFSLGERLTFDVKYGFIVAGIAEMHIPRIKKISGRESYHVTFKVNTVPSFDLFFKVRDKYETYIDTKGLFPWRFEQHIREGGFSKDFSAFFDQRKGLAITKNGKYEIPKYVNDIVSAFYIVRTFDFSDMQKGDKFNMQNFYDDKVYPLDVVYHGKETISVKAGTFDCIIVEPLVREGGLFKSEGSIYIWLTDDEVKMPVKVKTKVLIGSIDSELTAYEGIQGSLLSKK
ncbi:MAG: DUF3108 domain-containing protein [Ignavibacteria bacterium]|jgi:hypothetical protein